MRVPDGRCGGVFEGRRARASVTNVLPGRTRISLRYEARMRGAELGNPVDATTAFGTVRLTLRPETA